MIWWFGVFGCGFPAPSGVETCTLDFVLSPSAAEPGATVTATGGPLSDRGVRDVLVQVGGIRAEVGSADRDPTCTACDDCRNEAQCPPCGFCPGVGLATDRRVGCFGDPLADPPAEGSCDLCLETITFVVPADVPLGPASVVVFNSNGQSPPLSLDILAPATPTAPTTGDTAAP